MGFTPRMTCTLQCVSNNWLSSQYPHISHYVAHISPQWPLCVCECVQNEPTVWSQPLPWFFEKPFSFFGIMFSSGFLCAIFFFFYLCLYQFNQLNHLYPYLYFEWAGRHIQEVRGGQTISAKLPA